MKYVLDDLLRVRAFRETSRGNEMRAKKMLLAQAEGVVKKKEEELSEYRVWRVRREDDLFEEVKGRHINLKDLDDLKLMVGQMREKEALMENDVFEAESERETAEGVYKGARDAYHFAVKEKKKIEEHKKIWVKEVYREEEQARDKEMEEFQKMTGGPDMEEEDDEDI